MTKRILITGGAGGKRTRPEHLDDQVEDITYGLRFTKC